MLNDFAMYMMYNKNKVFNIGYKMLKMDKTVFDFSSSPIAKAIKNSSGLWDLEIL